MLCACSSMMYTVVTLYMMVGVGMGLPRVLNVAENSKDDNNKLIEKLKQELLHKNEDYYNEDDVNLNNNSTTSGRGVKKPNITYGKNKGKQKKKKENSLNLKNSLAIEREKGLRRHLESDISVEDFAHLITNATTNQPTSQQHNKTMMQLLTRYYETIRTTQTLTEFTTNFKPYTFRVHDISLNDVQAPYYAVTTRKSRTTTKFTTTTKSTTTTATTPIVTEPTITVKLRVGEDNEIKSSYEFNDNDNINDAALRTNKPNITTKNGMLMVKTTTQTTTTKPSLGFVKIRKRKKIVFNKEVPLSLLSQSEDTELDTKEVDMVPAQGSKVEERRLRGKLCDRSILIPEGPKYDSKGEVYLAAYNRGPRGEDFVNTKAPGMVLPKCCNCCQKSVLGCQ